MSRQLILGSIFFLAQLGVAVYLSGTIDLKITLLFALVLAADFFITGSKTVQKRVAQKKSAG